MNKTLAEIALEKELDKVKRRLDRLEEWVERVSEEAEADHIIDTYPGY